MSQHIDNLVQEILTQAQRYAHAWTVIGTPVDTGEASKRATAEKIELERLVRTSLESALQRGPHPFGIGPKAGLYLEADAIKSLADFSGLTESKETDLSDVAPLTLWIGHVTDDEGKKAHGVHALLEEYPEEGSITVRSLKDPEPDRDNAEARHGPKEG